MDGCSRQDPAYRPATGSPRESGGSLFARRPSACASRRRSPSCAAAPARSSTRASSGRSARSWRAARWRSAGACPDGSAPGRALPPDRSRPPGGRRSRRPPKPGGIGHLWVWQSRNLVKSHTGGADVSNHHQDPDSERRLLPALPSPDREANRGGLADGAAPLPALPAAGRHRASSRQPSAEPGARGSAAGVFAHQAKRARTAEPVSKRTSARPSATSRRRWAPGPSGS